MARITSSPSSPMSPTSSLSNIDSTSYTGTEDTRLPESSHPLYPNLGMSQMSYLRQNPIIHSHNHSHINPNIRHHNTNATLASQLDLDCHIDQNSTLIEKLRRLQETHSNIYGEGGVRGHNNNKNNNTSKGRRNSGVEQNAAEFSVMASLSNPEVTQEICRLEEENSSLKRENEALEATLAKQTSEVEQASTSIVNGHHHRQAMASILQQIGLTNLDVGSLDSDVQRLCSLSKYLSGENDRLKVRNRSLESEIASFSAERDQRERQWQKVAEDVQREANELRLNERRLAGENERLRKELTSLEENLIREIEEQKELWRAEREQLMEERSKLEKELSSAMEMTKKLLQESRKVDKLDDSSDEESEKNHKNRDAHKAEDKIEDLVELKKQLGHTRAKLESISQELNITKASKEETQKALELLQSKERGLAADLRLARSCLLKMKLETKEESRKSTKSKDDILEWAKERVSLLEMNKEVQKKLSELSGSFLMSLEGMEGELIQWKIKAEEVEKAIKIARQQEGYTDKRAGKQVYMLPIDNTITNTMHPPLQIMSSWQAKAASSALAGMGLLAYIKLKQQN